MKKYFTIITLAMLLTCLALPQNSVAQVKKNVLVECFTGTWCGWCPNGTVYLDSLTEKYPDKVLPLKVHYGDPMAFQESVFLAIKYAEGYPSGAVNRKPLYNPYAQQGDPDTVLALYPTLWEDAYKKETAEEAPLSVELYWTYDDSTKKIYAAIYADFAVDYSGNVNFNVFVVEDDVTGEGSGYEQRNSFSGDSRFKEHPYYDKPAVLKDYHFMNVLRYMAGGMWGTDDIIPQNVKAGDKYRHTYVIKKQEDWDMDNIKLYGLVQKFNENLFLRHILNCCKGVKVDNDLTIINDNPRYSAIELSERRKYEIQITNNSDVQKFYDIDIVKSDRTPSGWTLGNNLSDSDVLAIESNETIEASFDANVFDESGIGDLSLILKDNDAEENVLYPLKVTVITKDIKKVNVNGDMEQGVYDLEEDIKSVGRNDFLSMDFDDYAALIDSLPDLEQVIISCGEEGALENADSKKIGNLIDNGVDFIITGSGVPYILNAESSSLPSKLGYKWIAHCHQGQKTDGKVNLIGYPGDPISKGFSAEGDLISYYLPALEITKSHCNPILKHAGTDSISAVRSEVGDSKVVMLGFIPQIFEENDRRDLVNRCLNWLDGTVSVDDKILTEDMNIYVDRNPISQSGNLIIENCAEIPVSAEIELYDNLGNEVLKLFEGRINTGTNSYTIDAGSLSNCTYFININIDGKLKTLPVVVVK